MPIRTVLIPGTQVRQRYTNGVLTFTDSSTQANFQSWQEDRPLPVRRPKPSGWLYPTPYTLDIDTFKGGHGSYDQRINGNTVDRRSGALFGTMSNYSTINPLPLGNLVSRAEIKALISLKGQKVNLGVAFAEAQKSADLVGSTCTRLAKAYAAAKRGRFRQALQALGVGRVKQLPKTWLEMQYGWLPMLSEVHGGIQELLASEPHRFRITTKEKLYDIVHDDTVEIGSAAVNRRVKGPRRNGVLVRLDFTPGNAFLTSASRLGMTNPLEVAWELVPYSFVVDWFVPVGNYLGALDATAGLQFLSGSRTEYQSVKHVITPGPPTLSFLGGNFERTHKRISVRRYVYSSPPFPTPPGLNKSPLNLRRMTNGLSLLAQAFGRK